MLTDPRHPGLERVLQLASVGSTNSELRRLVEADPVGWPAPSVVVTDDQTAGRGRLDRVWSSAPGDGLAISLLLRPADAGLAWLPLLAGLAMAEAVTTVLGPERVSLKWPNDVLVDDRKVSGILAERLADGGVVVGAGVNVLMPAERLPVPTATSLAIAGVDGDPSQLVYDAYLTALLTRAPALSIDAAGLVGDAVRAVCGTIGRSVRVDLPGGDRLDGVAVGIADDGRLEVETAAGIRRVAAGDVTHLRY